MSQNQRINEFLDVFGNLTRRNILNMLSQEKSYVCEISNQLKVNRSAISRHLDNMETYGILESFYSPQKSIQKKFYKISTSRRLEVEITPNYFTVDLNTLNAPFENKYKIKKDFSDLITYEKHLKDIETVKNLNTKLNLLFDFAQELKEIYSKFDLARSYLKSLISRLKNNTFNILNKSEISQKDKKNLKKKLNKNLSSINLENANSDEIDEKIEKLKQSLFR